MKRPAYPAPALAALFTTALALGACGDGNRADDSSTPAATVATTSTLPVEVDPDAPSLTESGSRHNLIAQDDEGRTLSMGTVRIAYAESGWIGLEEEAGTPSQLPEGRYRVIALRSASCSGVGADADEGLGVVGEVHSGGSGSIEVWSTPVKVETISVGGVELVDADGVIVACSKRINWSEPATAADDSDGGDAPGA